MKLITAFFFMASLAVSSAHMNLINPLPRGSKLNPRNSEAQIDYSIMAPLGDGRPYPCQGKQPNNIVKTYNAGSSIQVQLEGSATHGGGHCQFAVSYDNGKNFVVLHTIERTCLLNGLTFNIPLPASAPACDHCIFAWTWLNNIGNRELYANCADIRINSNSDSELVGRELFVANIAPSNYRTLEGTAGSDVLNYLNQRATIAVGKNKFRVVSEGAIRPTWRNYNAGMNEISSSAPAPPPSSAPPQQQQPTQQQPTQQQPTQQQPTQQQPTQQQPTHNHPTQNTNNNNDDENKPPTQPVQAPRPPSSPPTSASNPITTRPGCDLNSIGRSHCTGRAEFLVCAPFGWAKFNCALGTRCVEEGEAIHCW